MLNDITLLKGDYANEILKLDDSSVDLILTDPPFGVTAAKWDSVINFDEMWLNINRVIKPNKPILIFGSEPFSSLLRISNLKNYKYDWTWVKNQSTNHLHAKRMPLRKTENISVFIKGGSWYNPQKTFGHLPTNSAKGCSNGKVYHGANKRDYKGGDTSRMPVNILYYNCVDNYSKSHPNEKPTELLEYLIKTYTSEGDTVLDFTAGSFSTGVAAINTNRKFIGIEMDNDYFEIGKKRIEDV